MYPFTQFYFTNETGAVAAAVTPFAPETIKVGELVLVDRNLNLITAATASRDLAQVHVISAKADGQPLVSAPIPTADLRGPIQYAKYAPYVPQTYAITLAILDAQGDQTPGKSTILIPRIRRTDNFTQQIVGREWTTQTEYTVGDVASEKQALINLNHYFQKAATFGTFTSTLNANGDTLTLTGTGPRFDEVGSMALNTFEGNLLFEHKREGYTLVSSTKFDKGAGLGTYLRHYEQKLDLGLQISRSNPDPTGFKYAVGGQYYNVYNITWDPRFLADMGNQEQRRATVTAAFATDATAAIGAQEAAFRTALGLAGGKAHNLVDADTTDFIEAAATANDPDSGAGASDN